MLHYIMSSYNKHHFNQASNTNLIDYTKKYKE